jgi:glutaredoxin 2
MDVRQVIGELGVRVEIRSIADDPAYRSELVRATGASTVPVLKIEHEDGSVRWLPESRDIIAFLYAHAGVAEPRLRLRPYALLRTALVLALLAWVLVSGGHAWL